MAAGEDLHIEGPISERLYHNLAGPYQRLQQLFLPSLNRVGLFPAELQSGGQRAGGVATGFANGIDSYCALGDYHYNDAPQAFRLTHLLFNNVGAHGAGGERLFRDRWRVAKQAAELIGLPIIKVNSNLDAIYGPGLPFRTNQTSRNASVAHMLGRGIGRFLSASTYDYSEIRVDPGDSVVSGGITHSDMVTLPMLSTDTLDTLSVGGEYTRVEKTLLVADLAHSWRTLDVCVSTSTSGNCSKCRNCMRTLLTLDIARLLDRYSGAFDLDVYMQHRARYIAEVLKSNDKRLRDILDLAVERGYSFPLAQRTSARLRIATRPLRRQIRPVLRVMTRSARKLRRRLRNRA